MNPKIESPSSAELSSSLESAVPESAVTENSDGENGSSSSPNPFRNFGIQDYLSLGYIYLLGVGIMTDAIYYKMLGVNILHFTSVLDVLVSPIAFMVKRPIIILFLVVLPFFVRWIQRRIKKKQEIERAREIDKKDAASRKRKQKLEEDLHRYFFSTIMGATAFFLFVGGGIGAGYRVSGRIADGDFRINYHLVFNDGEEVDAYVVGQNSDFIFYVTEGSGDVTIAPVRGNIKHIKQIDHSDQADTSERSDEAESANQSSQNEKESRKTGVSAVGENE